MGLRGKILSGFIILSLMLLIAGLWSIYEFRSIGSSVQKILDDNYESIHASKMMIESLEREDSAILLLLLGKWEEGRSIFIRADSLFTYNLNFADKNITIPGEKAHLDTIKLKYNMYKTLSQQPIVGTIKERNLDWYFNKNHRAFLDVRYSIEQLIDLNDRMMYKTATDLKNRSNRSIMPGIIAAFSALIFTLIFNYLVNFFVVSPIITITDRIKNFKDNKIQFDLKIETNDELTDLANSIQDLCQYVSAKDK